MHHISGEIYTALLKAKLVFPPTQDTVKFTEYTKVPKFMAKSLTYVEAGSSIPSCHNTAENVLERYFGQRFKIWTQQLKFRTK